jgi:hypothetical protein
MAQGKISKFLREKFVRKILKGIFDFFRFEGFWKEDKQHGRGAEYWPNGVIYIGEYFKGLRHGTGKLIFEDGAKYEVSKNPLSKFSKNIGRFLSK